jgi:3-deoxy-7-phosphoheptulonate synthase
MDSVETVRRIQEPYKAANRKFHPDDSVIDCSGVKIGGGAFSVIAGPCSVESEEQIVGIAKSVKSAGATMLRGGAFKPRTSPYAFQGMGDEGIRLLQLAKKETGLPIVTELMDFNDIELFNDVDVIQIGARNMQNFNLLKEVGSYTKKPILLERGMSATLQELLMSAEYIMASGNPNVILCERGIRTFETALRNTLDLGVVTLLHKLSHLPVVIDPSHATGHSWMVSSVAVAAAAIGADGLIIEVHNDPPRAKCDGAQSQTPEAFAKTVDRVNKVRRVLRSEEEI